MKNKYKLESEVFLGKFNAKTDYFTHTEWVKAKEGFGCVVFIFIAVSVWFLVRI